MTSERSSAVSGPVGKKTPPVTEVLNQNTPVPCAVGVFASVVPNEGEEPVVWTSSSTGAILLRNSETSAVIAKIENVNPTCMAVVGDKVWVGRNNGSINVYNAHGSLLTTLQNANDSLPVVHMLVCGTVVYTACTSKDIVEWDSRKFCVIRILFGPVAGDLIQALAWNGTTDPNKFVLFSATRGHIRLWNSAGKWTHSSTGGARSLCYVASNQRLWCATDRGVVVYATTNPTNPLLSIKTLLEGRSAIQVMAFASTDKVWVVTANQEAVIFDASSITPTQTLPMPTATGRNLYISHRKLMTKVWGVSDDGHDVRIWDSVFYALGEGTHSGAMTTSAGEVVPEVDPATGMPAGGDAAEMAKEIEHLRKKLRYVQSVGTIFRQRIGILFREKFRQRDPQGAGTTLEAADFEGIYRQALTDIAAASPGGAAMLQDTDVPGGVGISDRSSAGAGAGAIAGGDAQPKIDALVKENEALQLALNEALSANAQGASDLSGPDAEKATKFWMNKLKGSQDELETAKQEIERLSAMLHEMGPQRDVDIRRAHHICQVLKEKNALKEKEMTLLEENEQLKKAHAQSEEKYIELRNNLGEYLWKNMNKDSGESGLAALGKTSASEKTGLDALSKEKQYSLVVDQIRDDNEKLKAELAEAHAQVKQYEDRAHECTLTAKQNALLKTRIQKMKDAQSKQKVESTHTLTDMQHNIDVLTTTISQLQADVGAKEASVQELSSDKLKLMQDISRMNTILERYKQKVLALERETISRTKAAQIGQKEHQRETQTLCESLDSREDKIQQLQANFIDISEQLQGQIAQVSHTNHELDLLSRENMSLKSKLQQLDLLLDERRQFTGVLAEVQGRMEMAVEELKRAQSTAELASEMSNLEARIAGLTALEAQLKQKDDLIAVRDDDIQKLKVRLAMFERNVNTISAVFLQFPHSLEEMELMVMQCEEFRRLSGENPELEERVRLRQLETQARKQQQQQNQQQATALHLQAGVMPGSLDAATAALLARIDEDTDSDTEDNLPLPASVPPQRTPVGSVGFGMQSPFA